MRLNNRRNTINGPKVVSAYSHLKQINAQKKISKKLKNPMNSTSKWNHPIVSQGVDIIAEKKN